MTSLLEDGEISNFLILLQWLIVMAMASREHNTCNAVPHCVTTRCEIFHQSQTRNG